MRGAIGAAAVLRRVPRRTTLETTPGGESEGCADTAPGEKTPVIGNVISGKLKKR